jgi:pimeloyl-ACP methyl ester carboxylesterase
MKVSAVRMERRRVFHCLIGVCFAGIAGSSDASSMAQPERSILSVISRDGTPIAVECAGAGPSLVLVHGGTGDRTRWIPLFPLFTSRFTVCAMDRRGHGTSGDSPDYALQKEAEDVAAVVNSRPGPVYVMGHSYGGVAALEAAFLTNKISKLVLYEPPLQDRNHAAVAAKMERMIRADRREQALVTFMREIVMISPGEVAAMRARPSWPGLAATVEQQIRQVRALDGYRFDPKRVSVLKVPTLLLTGSKTASPELRRAIRGLLDSLPNRSLVVFEGQEHNAMDAIPLQFAETLTNFLLSS